MRAKSPIICLLAVLLLSGTAAAAAGPVAHPQAGWGPLTSERAARLVERTGYEPRPANEAENRTIPTRRQLKRFHRRSDMPYHRFVDGRFKGTTDEIIQWAAAKWGFDPDLLRGVASVETWWDMDFVGDDGDSFGLFQVRRPYHCCLPFMRDSTAFNADYYGAIVRAYYDGRQDWLSNPDVAAENAAPYAPRDIWGSVGAWVTGRWHVPANEAYVAKVRQRMAERVWLTPDFLGYEPID